MISYADLERIYRLERDSPVLQSIPDGFYSEVSGLADKPEMQAHREKILALLGDIHEKRVRKIILYALRSMRDEQPENINASEVRLYSGAVTLLTESRERILREKLAEKKEFDVPKTKVRILRPMPSIMASDLKEYGPFNGDEVVELPEDNARILAEQGIAEEIR